MQSVVFPQINLQINSKIKHQQGKWTAWQKQLIAATFPAAFLPLETNPHTGQSQWRKPQGRNLSTSLCLLQFQLNSIHIMPNAITQHCWIMPEKRLHFSWCKSIFLVYFSMKVTNGIETVRSFLLGTREQHHFWSQQMKSSLQSHWL